MQSCNFSINNEWKKNNYHKLDTETFVTKLFDTLKTNDYTKQNFHSERGKVKLDASNSEENPEDVTAAEADEVYVYPILI